MKINVKKTLFILILGMLMPNLVLAIDLDETVDEEIRKNYNPNKLVNETEIETSALNKSMQADNIKTVDESLPSLPNITKYGNSTKQSDVKNTTIVPKTSYMPYTGGNIKVRKGKSFDVISSQGISDWQVKGTILKFKTSTNVHGKGYTIPIGTVFQGEIIESHKPQITCYGGLVVIRVNSMIYKGQTVPLKAYVTRADDKKIFLNNIKGDRTFLKTMWKKGDWGRTLFNKMLSLTISLGAEGSTAVLSPFPIAYGTICLGANALASPITAFFSKGGKVTIPAGSNFRIKLLEDTFIN